MANEERVIKTSETAKARIVFY